MCNSLFVSVSECENVVRERVHENSRQIKYFFYSNPYFTNFSKIVIGSYLNNRLPIILPRFAFNSIICQLEFYIFSIFCFFFLWIFVNIREHVNVSECEKISSWAFVNVQKWFVITRDCEKLKNFHTWVWVNVQQHVRECAWVCKNVFTNPTSTYFTINIKNM